MTRVELNGAWWWVIGWSEGDDLVLAPVNPQEDYDAAVAAKVTACAKHWRA